MEKDILNNLKALERESRTQLAATRRHKRESRSPRNFTGLITQLNELRKAGELSLAEELFQIVRWLDEDNLTSRERDSLNARRKKIAEKLSSPLDK